MNKRQKKKTQKQLGYRPISIPMPPSLVEALDESATRNHRNRCDEARALIARGIERTVAQ